MIKFLKSEVDLFCSLVKQGYTLVLCKEYNYKPSTNEEGEEIENYPGEGWQTIWGEEGTILISSTDEIEIREAFSRRIKIQRPKLFFHKGGTHCGMLNYQIGWLHYNVAEDEELNKN